MAVAFDLCYLRMRICTVFYVTVEGWVCTDLESSSVCRTLAECSYLLLEADFFRALRVEFAALPKFMLVFAMTCGLSRPWSLILTAT